MRGQTEEIKYYPDRFGNETRGHLFYPKEFNVKIVEATRESYYDKTFCSGYWEEFSHGWLSAETKAEAYNMSHKDTERVKGISRFMEMNTENGKHFDKKSVDQKESIREHDEECLEDETNETTRNSRIYEINRKGLSQVM